ncbi:hypothetical protein LCGC14_1200280 [marine sediment metagenome]|uniref:Uncharacterized protein n=1 Tax=marine sediment metagenome TaxID=412755 RepID=A0A0F9M4E9_9ZZZZ
MNNPWHRSKPIGPKPKDIYRDISLPLKVLRRCRKPRWLHYHKCGTDVRHTDSPFSTVCGKTNNYRLFRGPAIVNQLSAVTCSSCLAVLKQTHWYCPTHGFIADEEVTFEETCEMCGNPVV